MCVVLFGVGGLYYFNLQNKKKTTVSTEPKITRTDYSAVARKTLDWIDQQRNSDGWYILERGCDYEKKTCDVVWDNEEGNKDGLIATWARFNFYQQTKDSKDLEIVKSDINKFYEKYPNGVDNALWICKITYDMWKSNVFDQEIKDKLEKICFDNKIMTADNFEIYWNIRSGRVDKYLRTVDAWKTWDGYRLSSNSFDAVFGYTSDLSYRYLWKKDRASLNELEKYITIQEKLLSEKKILEIDNLCLLGINYIDVYKNTKEEKYLNRSKEIYDEYVQNQEDKKIIKTSMCGLYSKAIVEISKDNSYMKELELNNNNLIKLAKDNGIYTVQNDGSFFTSVLGEIVMYKSVVNNALIIELLRN